MDIFFIFLSFASVEPHALKPTKDDNVVSRSFDYQDCVNVYGRRWATTNEPIRTILDTAIDSCDLKRRELEQILAVSVQKFPKKERGRMFREWMWDAEGSNSNHLRYSC